MIPRRALYVLQAICICTLLLLGWSAVVAQEPDYETFKNGHTVSGPFYQFYKSVKNPDRVFGQPITVVFEDPLQPGKQIQYFERARMELDPRTNEVSLARLGEWAYDPSQPGLPAPLQQNDPMCRTFPNGKFACYGFLAFYDEVGGQKYFGQPVTNALFTAESRLVQYFENARMEWRGEMPDGQHIVVTSLGQFDFDKRIGNPIHRRPQKDPNTIALIVPSLRAFSGRPLIANGEQQKVFALLQDQYGEPIRGAAVTIKCEVETSDGLVKVAEKAGLSTNEDGIAIIEFPIRSIAPNSVVRVSVTANSGGTALDALSWFRVWW